MSAIELETHRLRLVPGSVKHAESIFAEYREPVTRYMNYPPPESLEVLKDRLKRRETEIAEGKVVYLAVLLKETDEFLGCFALEGLDERTPEMGGWLKASAHGHHYGQEAAAALKQWADRHLDYDYLVWPCAVQNVPSRKLAEALGGEVHQEYRKTTAAGGVWDYVEYAIPRSLTSAGSPSPTSGPGSPA